MNNPTPNSRYQDKQGQFVTVKSCAFNRVEYIREGYPAPCVVPVVRFMSEFKFVPEASA
ncbi:TPA: DUF4222 domain-containing protein [Serratia marcescens]|nr:DUF4222 domain-containing protein [Serratia marcescens]